MWKFLMINQNAELVKCTFFDLFFPPPSSSNSIRRPPTVKSSARAFFDRIRYVFNFFYSFFSSSCMHFGADPRCFMEATWLRHSITTANNEANKRKTDALQNAFLNRENLQLIFPSLSMDAHSMSISIYFLLCLIDLRKKRLGSWRERMEQQSRCGEMKTRCWSWERDS